jgi:hypothetical protein
MAENLRAIVAENQHRGPSLVLAHNLHLHHTAEGELGRAGAAALVGLTLGDCYLFVATDARPDSEPNTLPGVDACTPGGGHRRGVARGCAMAHAAEGELGSASKVLVGLNLGRALPVRGNRRPASTASRTPGQEAACVPLAAATGEAWRVAAPMGPRG